MRCNMKRSPSCSAPEPPSGSPSRRRPAPLGRTPCRTCRRGPATARPARRRPWWPRRGCARSPQSSPRRHVADQVDRLGRERRCLLRPGSASPEPPEAGPMPAQNRLGLDENDHPPPRRQPPRTEQQLEPINEVELAPVRRRPGSALGLLPRAADLPARQGAGGLHAGASGHPVDDLDRGRERRARRRGAGPEGAAHHAPGLLPCTGRRAEQPGTEGRAADHGGVVTPRQRWITVPKIRIQTGRVTTPRSAKYSCAKGDSNPHGVTH